MLNFYVNGTLRNSAMMKKAITLLILCCLNAQANEQITDAVVGKVAQLETKVHVTNGLFADVSVNKSVEKLGIAYAYQHKDFLIMAGYNTEQELSVYGSFKPSTMMYQIGVELLKGHEQDALELEYTYFINRSSGAVVKYNTQDGWFVGMRKWL